MDEEDKGELLYEDDCHKEKLILILVGISILIMGTIPLLSALDLVHLSDTVSGSSSMMIFGCLIFLLGLFIIVVGLRHPPLRFYSRGIEQGKKYLRLLKITKYSNVKHTKNHSNGFVFHYGKGLRNSLCFSDDVINKIGKERILLIQMELEK